MSPGAVRRLVHALTSSLQAIPRQILGTEHRDREAQFRYVSAQVEAHLGGGQPAISVHTKEREVVVSPAQKRAERSRNRLKRLDVHEFGGVEDTDLPATEALVSLGKNDDAASFALNVIGRWWEMAGSAAYPNATRLLITAGGGGSGGYRNPSWRRRIAHLAEQSGLEVTVCHFPPSPSKGNRIERLLFSGLSLNWRGPLIGDDITIELIGSTGTRGGFKVRAEIVQGDEPKGTRMSRKEIAALPLTRHQFHGEWNYTAHPHPSS